MCIDDLDLQRVDPINRVTSCSMGHFAIVSVFIFMRNGMDYIVFRNYAYKDMCLINSDYKDIVLENKKICSYRFCDSVRFFCHS